MPIDINQLTPQEQITSIYISYYNRAPDALGMEFWTGQLDDGLSLEEIATTFSSAAETIGQFPFFDPDAPAVSPDNFLTSVYQNLFGRDPDAEGLAFWSDQLATGSTPVGEFLLAIVEGAQDVEGGTQDLSILTNKIEAGADWAASAAAAGLGTTEETAIAVDNGDGTFTINNADAFTSASTILNNVTEDPTTVSDAKDATDAFIADGTVPDDTPDDVPEDVAGDTFSVTANSADVDEGGTATFTVVAAEGADALTEGDEVSFTLSGVDAADVAGDLTGTATVNASGQAIIDVVLVEDATTEGAEALTVTLDDGASTSATVNDTSVELSGNTFNLTEAIETTTGTADDDQFNAFTTFVAGSGQVNTLQSGDTVNGGGGIDTLTAQFNGGNVSPTLNSIETLEATAFAGTVLNLANSDGLQGLTVKDSTADMAVSNVKTPAGLTVQNISGGNDAVLGYTSASLSGETIQPLTMSGLTMADAGGDIVFEDSEGAGTIEQLDITADGVAKVGSIVDASLSPSGLGGLGNTTATDVLRDLSTVNVNATGETELGFIGGGALTTFDASESTGSVKANLSGSASNDVTVTGGTGDDFITFGNGANLTENDSIDLGEGDNTLAITGDAQSTGLDVANVSTLQVTTKGSGNLNTVALGEFGAGVDAVDIVSANDGDTTALNDVANDSTVNVRDTAEDTNTIAHGGLTINGENVSGGDDTINVGLSRSEAGTTANPIAFTLNTLTAAGFENINIDSTGDKANTENVVTNLIANAQDAVSISGDKKLTIGNQLFAPTVDASENTGGVDIDVAGTGATGGEQTVTGSDGDDTIRVDTTTLDEDDTSIDAGDGEDTLAFSNTGTLNFDTVNDVAPFNGVTNFEVLSFGAAGATTVNISDAFLNVFTGDTINVVAPETAPSTLTLNAFDVVTSNATINVDASEMGSSGFRFSLNNGTSTFTGSDQNDQVVVTTGSFLGGGDTLDGGDGLDFLTFGTTDATVIQASQLSGVENFEVLEIFHGSDDTGDAFEITLDNAFASANQDSNGDLFVDTRTSGSSNNDDAVSVDASGVSSSTDITMDLGGLVGENTVTLGSGDDTVELNASTDTVTLGSGKDDVEINSLLDVDNTITDFDFGTSSGSGANVDQFDVRGLTLANAADGGVELASSGTFDTDGAGGDDTALVVLDGQGYANIGDAVTDLDSFAGGGTTGDDVLFMWQDTLGDVHLSYSNDAGATTSTDLAVVEDVTISGVANNIDSGDFMFA